MNTQIVATPDGSPFDSIRRVNAHGEDYWSSRELGVTMGYTRFENFMTPLKRAMTTASNQGFDVEVLFLRSQEKGLGRPAEDFELSRFAAYLVAMNGDPNKSEVASAQAYFAIQTRVAETAPAAPALPQSYGEALRELASNVEARELAEQRARALEVPAAAWGVMVSAAGDYGVEEAAKVLSRDHNLTIGRNRLFTFMQSIGWIYRHGPRNGWHAYQTQVDSGRIVLKMSAAFLNAKTGEMENPSPTIRITAKGLEALRVALVTEEAA